MKDLLKLCGYRASEIDSELHRVEKAFDKLGITTGDIERGKQRLARYYAGELEGIRKILRLCLQDLVNSVLAREEGKTKIMFGFMAPGFETIGSVLLSRSKTLYSAQQSWSFLLVLGCIFDKLVPVLEAAEKSWLKAGAVAHCANVKIPLGLLALNLIPRPDLMMTSGYLCEIAPKTVDLVHETYGIPVCCCDTCRDQGYKEPQEATRRAADLAAKGMRKYVERVEELVGFKITNDMLWEVINARSRLESAMGQIRRLVEASDPLVMSPTNDSILSTLQSLPLSLENIAEAVDAINTLHKELQQRVARGQGVVPKGSPRILGMLPMHHTDPRLEHLVTQMGIAISASDFTFTIPHSEASTNPYERMAMHLRSSLSSGTPGRLASIMAGCKRLNLDGVLNRYHVGCRAVSGDVLLIKQAVEKELGKPVLLLEWENFDPRVFKQEEYTRRLELFKEMLTNQKR